MNQPLSFGWDGFVRRLLGALRLNGDTFRELSFVPNALPQAIAVILLGSLASAIVYLVDGDSPSLSVDVNWNSYPVTRESDVLAALAGAVLDAGWGLMIWAVQTAIICFLWNRFSRNRRTWRSIAAPLGFASAPLIVFALLELVPTVGSALALIGLLWTFVASVAAIRASLSTGWGRAVVLLLVSTVALFPIPLVISWLS